MSLYVRMGIVNLVPFQIPLSIASTTKDRVYGQRSHEVNGTIKNFAQLIAINDCIYRNANRFEYLAIVDYDDIIIPRHARTLQGMMTNIINQKDPNKTFAGYEIKGVQFCDSEKYDPKIGYKRVTTNTRFYESKECIMKSIVRPMKALYSYAHSVIKSVGKNISFPVPGWFGRKHHYREGRPCPSEGVSNNMNAHTYQEELTRRIRKILARILH